MRRQKADCKICWERDCACACATCEVARTHPVVLVIPNKAGQIVKKKDDGQEYCRCGAKLKGLDYQCCATHVLCDDPACRALDNPRTFAEWRAAAIHWRRHHSGGGCSHGC